MSTVTTARRSRAGLWVALVGAVVAIAGLITMGVAASRRAHYQEIADYRKALGNPFADPQVAAAVTLGHIGLGILIFGAALFLVGLAVQLLRR